MGVGVEISMAYKDRGAEFAVFKSGLRLIHLRHLVTSQRAESDAERSQELMAFNNLRSQVAYICC